MDKYTLIKNDVDNIIRLVRKYLKDNNDDSRDFYKLAMYQAQEIEKYSKLWWYYLSDLIRIYVGLKLTNEEIYSQLNSLNIELIEKEEDD